MLSVARSPQRWESARECAGQVVTPTPADAIFAFRTLCPVCRGRRGSRTPTPHCLRLLDLRNGHSRGRGPPGGGWDQSHKSGVAHVSWLTAGVEGGEDVTLSARRLNTWRGTEKRQLICSAAELSSLRCIYAQTSFESWEVVLGRSHIAIFTPGEGFGQRMWQFCFLWRDSCVVFREKAGPLSLHRKWNSSTWSVFFDSQVSKNNRFWQPLLPLKTKEIIRFFYFPSWDTEAVFVLKTRSPDLIKINSGNSFRITWRNFFNLYC